VRRAASAAAADDASPFLVSGSFPLFPGFFFPLEGASLLIFLCEWKYTRREKRSWR
jgi:hypothetical protein